MLTCAATNPTLGETASAEKKLRLQCKKLTLNSDKDKDGDTDKYSDKDKRNDTDNGATNQTLSQTASAEKRLPLQCKKLLMGLPWLKHWHNFESKPDILNLTFGPKNFLSF